MSKNAPIRQRIPTLDNDGALVDRLTDELETAHPGVSEATVHIEEDSLPSLITNREVVDALPAELTQTLVWAPRKSARRSPTARRSPSPTNPRPLVQPPCRSSPTPRHPNDDQTPGTPIAPPWIPDLIAVARFQTANEGVTTKPRATRPTTSRVPVPRKHPLLPRSARFDPAENRPGVRVPVSASTRRHGQVSRVFEEDYFDGRFTSPRSDRPGHV